MWITSHCKFCARCLSHNQKNLSKTGLFGTGYYSTLSKTPYKEKAESSHFFASSSARDKQVPWDDG